LLYSVQPNAPPVLDQPHTFLFWGF
jgi:hypothetical protein